MIMLLSVAPIMSMTPAQKTTINTVSCFAALHAMHVDFATSEIVKFNQLIHKDLKLPIYSSPIAPAFSAFAIAACATNHTAAGLLLAQQSLQCAYVRRAFVNTAVENLIHRKKLNPTKKINTFN